MSAYTKCHTENKSKYAKHRRHKYYSYCIVVMPFCSVEFQVSYSNMLGGEILHYECYISFNKQHGKSVNIEFYFYW